MKSYLGQSNLPRGIRNNNPGNLIRTSSGWLGKIPFSQSTDSHFEQFTFIEYGIRAMAYDIIGDVNKGKNTLTLLIHEYAPPFENDTVAYINSVSDSTGLAPTAPIVLSEDFLKEVIKAKIKVENGASALQYVTDQDIVNGINLLPANMLAGLKKKEHWTV